MGAVQPEGLAVDEAPVPDQGNRPTRRDAEAAISHGLPAPGEALAMILATLLRIEDQISAALAPPAKKKE